MNTRHILLALGLLATVACTAEPSDSTDATEDEYRVKPRGNSTLGALTIDVPDGVRPGQDRQTLMVSVRSQAPDGTISPDAQYVDLPGAKLPPGTYCLYVESATDGADRLRTHDCGITITGGRTTTYRLSKVSTSAADVAFMQTQQGRQGYADGATFGGPGEVSGGLISFLGPVSLAATKSEIVVKVGAPGGHEWEPVTTIVRRGSDVTLALPNQNKIVRVTLAAQRGELPDAVPGGGMHWSWAGAPSPFAAFGTPRAAPKGETLSFFTAPGTSVVVELAGQVKRYPLDAPKNFAAYAYRIDVDPVADDDNFGNARTFPGEVTMSLASGAPLVWTTASGTRMSSFTTGHGVSVWAGTYDMIVYYTADGVSKTYRETISVP